MLHRSQQIQDLIDRCSQPVKDEPDLFKNDELSSMDMSLNPFLTLIEIKERMEQLARQQLLNTLQLALLLRFGILNIKFMVGKYGL